MTKRVAGLAPAGVVAAAVTLAVSLCGCGDRLPAPDIVASIDGDEIPFLDFEVYLSRNSADPEAALGSDVLSALFDEFLTEELVRRLAVDKGLVELGAGSRAAAVALAAEAAASVSEAEIAAYYRENRSEFELSQRVRLSQILVADRSRAEEALRTVRDGTPFAEAARRFSEDPAGRRGGDQGILTRLDVPPAFVETIFALEEGEVSDLVEAEYGVHIFYVSERRPEEVVPLATAADGIRRRLEVQGAQAHLERVVAQARERYNTRVFRRNLPFNYQGRYGTNSTGPSD